MRVSIDLPTDRLLTLRGLESLTDAELEALSRLNPTLRIERSATGEILFMPPTHTDSGRRNAHITLQVGQWWQQTTALGEFFDSNTGFTLPDGSMRSPDAAWVSAALWGALTAEQQKRQYSPVCPEFVIELRSGTDGLRDLQRKMTDVWLANGTQLAFLLDADAETAYVYRAGQTEPEVFQGYDRELAGDPVLPGFRLNLRLVR